MDTADNENTPVSLPGAGETEPTILEQLNFGLINTNQQEKHLEQHPEHKEDQQLEQPEKQLDQNDSIIISAENLIDKTNSDNVNENSDLYNENYLNENKLSDVIVVVDDQNPNGCDHKISKENVFLQVNNIDGNDVNKKIFNNQNFNENSIINVIEPSENQLKNTNDSISLLVSNDKNNNCSYEENSAYEINECDSDLKEVPTISNICVPTTSSNSSSNSSSSNSNSNDIHDQNIALSNPEQLLEETSVLGNENIQQQITTNIDRVVIIPLPINDDEELEKIHANNINQIIEHYRELSASPPPLPLVTYRWEDVRRSKEKGGYPWTYLNPHEPKEFTEDDINKILNKNNENNQSIELSEQDLDTINNNLKIEQELETKSILLNQTIAQNIDDIPEQPRKELNENECKIFPDELINEELSNEELISEELNDDENKTRVKEHTSKKFLDQINESKVVSVLKNTLKRSTKKNEPSTIVASTDSNNNTNNNIEDNNNNNIFDNLNNNKVKCCHPIVDKLKTMADKQLHKVSNKKMGIKRINVPKDDQKIILDEQTKIIKLKDSPRADHKDMTVPCFEKQDSDDILEIIELDESPSEIRKRRETLDKEKFPHPLTISNNANSTLNDEKHSSILIPDEIIDITGKLQNQDKDELNNAIPTIDNDDSREPTVAEILEEEFKNDSIPPPPVKLPRKQKEHVYEDIDDPEMASFIEREIQAVNFEKAIQFNPMLTDFISENQKTLKQQDDEISKQFESTITENELTDGIKLTASHISSIDSNASDDDRLLQNVSDTNTSSLHTMSSTTNDNLLAPISSIDSTSSDEDKHRKRLSGVSEESSDRGSFDIPVTVKFDNEDIEIRSVLKRESSPALEGKKVTFSPSTENDPDDEHREDVELPNHIKVENRWANMSDHEYEPIGEPQLEPEASEKNICRSSRISETPPSVHITESSPQLNKKTSPLNRQPSPVSINDTDQPIQFVESAERNKLTRHSPIDDEGTPDNTDDLIEIDLKAIEDSYYKSASTPTTDQSRTDEIHTSQIDSSTALEELPLRREDRKKGFMSSATDHTKQMHEKLKSKAGKLRTKFKSGGKTMSKPSIEEPSEETTTTDDLTHKSEPKEKRKFKGAEFSKLKNIQMPKINKPEFRRPEFTKFKVTLPDRPKFTKPDMSKFKIPEKFSSLRLTRSSSLKKPPISTIESISGETPHTTTTGDLDFDDDIDEPINTKPSTTTAKAPKKRFDFGTYPRIFDRKRKEINYFAKDDEDDNKKSDKNKKTSRSASTPVTSYFATFPKMTKKKKTIINGEEINGQNETVKVSFDKNLDTLRNSEESGKYQRFGSEPSDILGRESSLERRMRLTLNKGSIEDEEYIDDTAEGEEQTRRTDEQKQMRDFDDENREIHKISKAREDEFRARKPILIHQESDVVSEDSNREIAWVESIHLRKRLLKDDNKENVSSDVVDDVEDDEYLNEKDRLSATQTNLETQSSGSSSTRQRKGVIDEIDGNEFYLRKHSGGDGSSQDDMEIRKYISSDIRDGFDTPINALSALGRDCGSDDRYLHRNPYYNDKFIINNQQNNYNYDIPPRKPRRVFQKSLESDEFNADKDSSIVGYDDYHDDAADVRSGSLPVEHNNQFRTFPPNRPTRKNRKKFIKDDYKNDFPQQHQHEHDIPVAAQYYPHPDEENLSFYDNDNDNDHDNIDNPNDNDKFGIHMDNILLSNISMPPVAPKRRRKIRDSIDKESIISSIENDPLAGRSVSHNFIPIGNADDLVVFRTQYEYNIPLAKPESFSNILNTGSRSLLSHATDDDRTSHGADSMILDSQIPEGVHDMKRISDIKDTNGYATVKKEPPPRPPAPLRRKRSTKSLGDRQFATLPLTRKEKDREPIPERPIRNYTTIGPTKPPRRTPSIVSLGEPQRNPSLSTSDVTQYEEIDDVDRSSDPRNLHSGEVLNKMKYRPLPPPPRPPRERKAKKSLTPKSDGNIGGGTDNNEDNDDININKFDRGGGGEKLQIPLKDISRISSVDTAGSSRISSIEIEEVERATQTDPMPYDFICDEFEITEDMKIIEPRVGRKLKTLEDILREEQQAEMERARQLSDEQCLTRGINKFREANQRNYSERSRASTGERPKTPLSRPITPSTAVIIERKISTPTMETDAKLIVRPVLNDSETDIDRMDGRDSGDEIPYMEDGVTTEDERIVNEAIKRYELLTDDDYSHTEIQQPKENYDILDADDENIDMETRMDKEETPPIAPPRRKSSATVDTLPVSVSNMELSPVRDQNPVVPDPPVETLMPSGTRLHLTELEVENLSVSALQAGRILVSDLQSMSINAQDFECKSGNLIVKNIELPEEFLEQLIERVRINEQNNQLQQHHQQQQRTTEQHLLQSQQNEPPQTNVEQQISEEQQQSVKEEQIKQSESIKENSSDVEPPPRPPPPVMPLHLSSSEKPIHQVPYYPSDIAPYSTAPSFYNQVNFSDDELQIPPNSTTPPPSSSAHRRRRYNRRRDSTSEEEYQRRTVQQQLQHRSPEPSIGNLSGQLFKACSSAVGRTGERFMNMVKANNKDEKKRDLNLTLIILIIIVATLMLLGISGDRTIHHHHWDYFNPPDNSVKK